MPDPSFPFVFKFHIKIHLQALNFTTRSSAGASPEPAASLQGSGWRCVRVSCRTRISPRRCRITCCTCCRLGLPGLGGCQRELPVLGARGAPGVGGHGSAAWPGNVWDFQMSASNPWGAARDLRAIRRAI